MLQQTQASRVVPAYRSFLERFPTLRALAEAPRRDVIAAWVGLGYNRRAVALAAAARAVVRDHGGRVPSDPALLQRLSGVGPYTAAAVASLAFGLPVAAVDTNVRRIVGRAFLGVDPEDVPVVEIRRLAQAWLDARDPGAWNQALMDLGREICRPHPRCDACPLGNECRFSAQGRPHRPARREQPAFEGSFRQVRGAIVRILRERPQASLSALAEASGLPVRRVAEAVTALVSDGLVEAGPAALRGDPRGRARLAS